MYKSTISQQYRMEDDNNEISSDENYGGSEIDYTTTDFAKTLSPAVFI